MPAARSSGGSSSSKAKGVQKRNAAKRTVVRTVASYTTKAEGRGVARGVQRSNIKGIILRVGTPRSVKSELGSASAKTFRKSVRTLNRMNTRIARKRG